MYSRYVTLRIVTQPFVFCNVVGNVVLGTLPHFGICRASRQRCYLLRSSLLRAVVMSSRDIQELRRVLKPCNNTRRGIIIGSERNWLAAVRVSVSFLSLSLFFSLSRGRFSPTTRSKDYPCIFIRLGLSFSTSHLRAIANAAATGRQRAAKT